MPKNTTEIKEKRLKAIQDIQLQYEDPENKLTQKTMIRLLKERGYSITKAQLDKDLRVMRSENKWLSDLAKKNYSAFIEARINNMLYCSSEIKQMIQADDMKPNVKMHALKLLHTFELELAKLVSSDILRISASNWAVYVKGLEQEIITLKNMVKAN